MVLGALMQHATIHGVHHRDRLRYCSGRSATLRGIRHALFDAEKLNVLAW